MSVQKKRKIVNDPVYGFINITSGLLFELIENPCFQRLRRISQLGLTNLVYPGAQHTRFQHSLGAMHLMEQALDSLRYKGFSITDEEVEGAMVAILLHDLGHGPFSHSLEGYIVEGVSHESLTLHLMKQLNAETEGALDLALSVFEKTYPKKFLCQLVSGQLDMDRLDYLRRDSFFTGVIEGAIGSDRIIKMLSVYNDELVVEAKGIYSIEKFLIARRLMYWQVYMHKTGVSADVLMSQILRRARFLIRQGHPLWCSPALTFFLSHNRFDMEHPESLKEILFHFQRLDDLDLLQAAKVWVDDRDRVLSLLCSNLVNRRLFRIIIRKTPYTANEINEYSERVAFDMGLSSQDSSYFVHTGRLTNNAYNNSGDGEIRIMTEGEPLDIALASDLQNISELTREVEKYYLCYPKNLNFNPN